MALDELVRINDEDHLLDKLREDVDNSGKPTVVFQAGHFPLEYQRATSSDYKLRAAPNFERWGPFSLYTAQIAARVGEYARKQGKDSKFIFMADDSYSNSKQRTARRRFFKDVSGDDAKLHKEIGDILDEHGFDEADVIRHDHGKPRRQSSLYFSETNLQHPRSEVNIDSDKAESLAQINDGCAKGYSTLLESDYLPEDGLYLVSFIPDICQGNVCERALDGPVSSDIRGSHIFMTTELEGMRLSDVDDLYRGSVGEGSISNAHQGVRYRAD